MLSVTLFKILEQEETESIRMKRPRNSLNFKAVLMELQLQA